MKPSSAEHGRAHLAQGGAQDLELADELSHEGGEAVHRCGYLRQGILHVRQNPSAPRPLAEVEALHPWLFAVEPLLSPAITGLLMVLFQPTVAACVAFSAGLMLQLACTAMMMRLLRGEWPGRWIVLAELLRPCELLACWLGALSTRRVPWRGHAFLLPRKHPHVFHEQVQVQA